MKSKTAIVTGAAGCLGSNLTARLVHAGWNVVMLDKDRRGLERVYDEIEPQSGGQASLYPMDLAGATPDLFAELLENVGEQFGGLDALVHCAVHFENLTPVEHVPPEDWLLGLQVNLNAPWLLSAMAIPMLRESGSGKLVFSLEDMDKVKGALWGVYGVAKHALFTLVSQLDSEHRNSGLEVRGINPGPMRSPVRTGVYHAENPSEMPGGEGPAGLVAAFLEGKVSWDDVFVDLPSLLND